MRSASGVGVVSGWSVDMTMVVGTTTESGARVGVGSRVAVGVDGKGEFVSVIAGPLVGTGVSC